MTQTALTLDFSGMAKEIYSTEGILNLIPEVKILTGLIPFETGEKVGNLYHQPVQVTTENGRAFAAPGTLLNIPTTSTFQMQDAQVNPYQVLIASNMDYETHFRAYEEGKAAFASATQLQFRVMAESAVKTTEIQLVYGQDFLAKISACSASTSPAVLTVATGEWAAGIWAGFEGVQLDFWEGSSTIANTNAGLVVSAVDPVAKTITVTGNNTDLAAINTYVAANPGSGGVVFRGTGITSRGDQEMVGMKGIISNTGTLFNINAANFNLWKGNTYSAGSTSLTFAKIQTAVAQLVGRGLNEKLSFFINPVTWGNLLTDQASLRQYDSSYSEASVELGSKSIKFYSQNGELEIVSHLFVKEGDAFALPTKRAKRIGSTDWTLGIPGTMQNEVYIQNPTTASFSYRMYTQQSLFIEKPAACLYVSNIVNS